MKNKFVNISIFLMLTVSISYAEQSIKKEIIDKCRKQMQKYSPTSETIKRRLTDSTIITEMVKFCVNQNIDAVISLNKLIRTKKYNSIVSRCMSEMQKYGYIVVEFCVKQDIKAEKALRAIINGEPIKNE